MAIIGRRLEIVYMNKKKIDIADIKRKNIRLLEYLKDKWNDDLDDEEIYNAIMESCRYDENGER